MTTINLYRKHKAGDISREKFLYEVRRDNNLPFITNLTSYDDAVTILKNKGIVTEVETKESTADEAVKAEVKAKKISEKKPKTLHIDVANPYEYRHGLAHELDALDEYTDEALEKAKVTVLKNLAKDANFYSNLLNAEKSPFTFKQPETNKPGMQAKADGTLKKGAGKLEKANVKDNLGKKEEGSKKPKGVKVMSDKGVTGSQKTIKEGSLNEVILKIYKYDPSSFNLKDVDVEYFGSEDEAKKAALAHHWQIAFDNGDTELSKDEFVVQTKWEDLEPYDNYGYDIVPDKGVTGSQKTIKEGLKGKFDSDDNIYTYDHLIKTDSPNKEELSKVLDAIKKDKEELEKKGKKVKQVKGDTVPYLELIKEGSFMGGVDLGASFDKMKSGMSAEDGFENLMKKYDWYAEFSDDSNKWSAQQRMEDTLKQLAKTIGADKAVEIYNSYAPSDRKVTSSHFLYEDKHSKIKEALKKGLKELINPKDIQAAKTTGDVVNIPTQDTAAQTAAKNAKINFRTYG